MKTTQIIKKWAPFVYWCAYMLTNSKEISRLITIDTFVHFKKEGITLSDGEDIEKVIKKIFLNIITSDFCTLYLDSPNSYLEKQIDELWSMYKNRLISHVILENTSLNIADDVYKALFLKKRKVTDYTFSFVNCRLDRFVSTLFVLFIPFLFTAFAYYIFDHDKVIRKNLYITNEDIQPGIISVPNSSKSANIKNNHNISDSCSKCIHYKKYAKENISKEEYFFIIHMPK